MNRNPFRLRAGDTVHLDGQPCAVIRVTETSAAVQVIRPAREFTTRFGLRVRLQPRPAVVHISPNAEIPILDRLLMPYED